MIVVPPWTPTACADTPTHAAPERSIWRCDSIQPDGLSNPGETLTHSTKTVPLKSSALIGRYTTRRVVNGAVDAAVTAHLPSVVSGVALVYAVASPATKYSADS